MERAEAAEQLASALQTEVGALRSGMAEPTRSDRGHRNVLEEGRTERTGGRNQQFQISRLRCLPPRILLPALRHVCASPG